MLSFSSKEVAEKVSKVTVEALQYRINPCLHETERQTVESLLYIPGERVRLYSRWASNGVLTFFCS